MDKVKTVLKKQKTKARADKIVILDLIKAVELLLIERRESAKVRSSSLAEAIVPHMTRALTAVLKPTVQGMDGIYRVFNMQAEAMKSLASIAGTAEQAVKLASRAGQAGGSSGTSYVHPVPSFVPSGPVICTTGPTMATNAPAMATIAPTMATIVPTGPFYGRGVNPSGLFASPSTSRGFGMRAPLTPSPSPGFKAGPAIPPPTLPRVARRLDMPPPGPLDLFRAQHDAMMKLNCGGQAHVDEVGHAGHAGQADQGQWEQGQWGQGQENVGAFSLGQGGQGQDPQGQWGAAQGQGFNPQPKRFRQ